MGLSIVKKYRVAYADIWRDKIGLSINFYPVILKEKFATKTEHGHWRVESPANIRIHFLFWRMEIVFSTKYWDDWCKKENIKNGYLISVFPDT